ncbi:hypothetical protein Bb109J_c0188 [Bdellovibrio bacteriovorus]|uniref:hemagglutinin n=1 Tax=Bdellovibrio bacteriovorus TaxID=959 RepID=UPI00045C0BFA|nr:hemagglutinin [Bdellovibrio bacteriovorus]AHZ85848.1 hemagglutinin [Bdellovibrio bacteriovorus]BEV66768.1 hypothetical protein Bb109J_c0188 [Bdellovibrio bacteriovorus]
MNVTALSILLITGLVSGCTLVGNLTDYNSLTPPVLTDSNGSKIESLIINSSDSLSHYNLRGECYYPNQKIDVIIQPSLNSLSTMEPKTFSTVCQDGSFSLDVNTQGWPDAEYTVKLEVTSLAGVKSSNETAVTKDIIAPNVGFSSPLPAEVGNALIVALPVDGTCESADGPVTILSQGVTLATFTCSNGTFSGPVIVGALNDGATILQVSQTDSAGNTGTANSTTFNKDSLAPLQPVTFGSLGSALSNNDADRSVTVTVPADATQYRYVIVKDTDCSNQWAALMATTPVPAGTPATFSFAGDGEYRLCFIAGDQADNWQPDTAIIESGSVIIDTVGPALNITSPLAGSKHKSAVTVSGTCEAGASLNLSGDYSTSPSAATCSVGGTFSFNITLTATDGLKNFTLSSTDGAGNTTNHNAYSLIRDNAIVAPSVTLNTATVTNNPEAKFTVNDCSDATFILMKEVNAPPALGDSGWIACSTVAQNYSFDLSANGDQQGLRNVRFYARDEAGNVSTATVFTITYDSKAPILTLDPVPTLAINVSYPFVVYVTEATVTAAATLHLDYSTDGGTTWNVATSRALGLAGPMNNKSFTVDWTPNAYNTDVQVRARLTDSHGLTGTGVSNAFDVILDTIKPVITAGEMKINGQLDPDDTVRSYVTVSLKATDAETAITKFCLKTANSAPNAADSCWVSVKAPKPGLAELPALTLVDFDFFLGINFGIYNVYAWVMDVGGNISTNSATLEKDYNTINYVNDPPPVVANFLTVNSATPNNPPNTFDMNFANGAAAHISWQASDNGTIAKVELFYALDGQPFTLISDTLANNSSNSTACGYSAPRTGCYLWNSTVPNDTFFKLQIRVTDNNGQTSQVTSPPLNSGAYNLIAGNQDPGHDGNAKSTVFNTNVNTDTAPGTVLVTTDGKIFFNDSSYGIIYIDPTTNNSKVLLRLAKENETAFGDGIPVEQARAKAILRTALDYQNRILVYDREMIRRIDTNVTPMTIETLIGADPAGNLGTDTADTVADPRDLKINIIKTASVDETWSIRRRSPFIPMPNGDLYFISEKPGTAKDNGGRIRLYKGSLAVPRVESVRFSGAGVLGQPAWDLNTMPYSFFSLRFDPATSAIQKAYVQAVYSVPGNSYGPMTELDPVTLVGNGVFPNHPFGNSSLTYYEVQGMDGRVYRANRATENSVSQLQDDGTWVRVLGTGAQGECADGTDATSCAVALDDVFVDRYGRMFFSARGIIKTVVNGKVYTLFGQRKDAGDGGSGFDMRLASVTYIDHSVGDGVMLLDHQQNKLREVFPGSSPEVRLVAGDGANNGVNFGIAANLQSILLGNWWDPNQFATNPANGDVYMNCANNRVLTTPPSTYTVYHSICRLNRATGMWEQILNGEGATPSYTQTSINHGDLLLAGYSPEIVAYKAGDLLMNNLYWNGTAHHNATFRLITPTTTHHVGGRTSVDSDSDDCPDGLSTDCSLGVAGVHRVAAPVYFDQLSGWMYTPPVNVSILTAKMHVLYSGNVKTLLTLPQIPSAYAYDSAGSAIYYCGNVDKKLYKVAIHNAGDLGNTAVWPLASGTHFTVTELPMPTDSITCQGRRILIKAASGPKPKRLVFMAMQNGLPAVSEYFLP